MSVNCLGFIEMDCVFQRLNQVIILKTFFYNAVSKIALYTLDDLAKDINEKSPPVRRGFPGITLAYNAKSEEEVEPAGA